MGEFQSTVSALCYSIIQERCRSLQSDLGFPHNDAVRFVLGQHGRMTAHMRFPLIVLTLVFDWWGLVRFGGLFHRLSHGQRWRQIEAWQASSFGFCRDLMRFYESLVLFHEFSRFGEQTARDEQSESVRTRTAA